MEDLRSPLPKHVINIDHILGNRSILIILPFIHLPLLLFFFLFFWPRHVRLVGSQFRTWALGSESAES